MEREGFVGGRKRRKGDLVKREEKGGDGLKWKRAEEGEAGDRRERRGIIEKEKKGTSFLWDTCGK